MTVTLAATLPSALTPTGWVETASRIGRPLGVPVHEPRQLVTTHGVDPQQKQGRLTAQFGPDPGPERENTRLELTNWAACERNTQGSPERLAPCAKDGRNRRLHLRREDLGRRARLRTAAATCLLKLHRLNHHAACVGREQIIPDRVQRDVDRHGLVPERGATDVCDETLRLREILAGPVQVRKAPDEQVEAARAREPSEQPLLTELLAAVGSESSHRGELVEGWWDTARRIDTARR